MKTRRDLYRALGIATAAIVLGAAPARAEDELPPERPTTPYSATVRNTFSITKPGGGSSGGDTIEIRVSGARLLEESRIMEEKSVIVDMEKHEAIEFDPKATDKVAARFPLNDAPIPYIQGRAGLAACVSKQGVVVRAKIKFPNYQREFEALDFDAGKQDEKYFRPPDDFKVVEGAGPEDAEQTE
jgi:hypothetical protein